jgi:hypothetical protein
VSAFVRNRVPTHVCQHVKSNSEKQTLRVDDSKKSMPRNSEDSPRQEIENAPGAAPFWFSRSIDKPGDPGMQQCPAAHCAWFERYINAAALKPVVSYRRGRILHNIQGTNFQFRLRLHMKYSHRRSQILHNSKRVRADRKALFQKSEGRSSSLVSLFRCDIMILRFAARPYCEVAMTSSEVSQHRTLASPHYF